jgi:hypothetical protein
MRYTQFKSEKGENAMRNVINGVFGIASGAFAWVVGSMEHVESAFRFIGVVAGSIAACVSLAVAIRSWRKNGS